MYVCTWALKYCGEYLLCFLECVILLQGKSFFVNEVGDGTIGYVMGTQYSNVLYLMQTANQCQCTSVYRF